MKKLTGKLTRKQSKQDFSRVKGLILGSVNKGSFTHPRHRSERLSSFSQASYGLIMYISCCHSGQTRLNLSMNLGNDIRNLVTGPITREIHYELNL